MKKVYFLLLGLFLFSEVNGQVINFPDANFKAKLLASDASNFIVLDLAGNSLKIDANSNSQIEVTEALQVSYINVNSSSISNLTGILNFNNLKRLRCYSNLINSLDISGLSNIEILECDNNSLTTLNLTNCTNLITLDCRNNNLTILDVSGLNALQSINCSSNNLTTLSLGGIPNITYLDCSNNQLSNVDFSGLNALSELNCNYNLFQILDISNLPALNVFKCTNNNPLTAILMKHNGLDQYEYYYDCGVGGNPNLKYICVEDAKQYAVYTNLLAHSGVSGVEVNSYCSFVPSNPFYVVQGNNRWDINNNGCDVSDLTFPFFKLKIVNNSVTRNYLSGSSGNYYIPIESGTNVVTPVLENPNYFNVFPTSKTITFPTQASPFTQDFCITANGVHPDLEVTLLPINVARPGFDAKYKIIYRNKGNQTQSGSVNLTFNDGVLDFVSANPMAATQTTNNLSWDFTNLLPFEIREIELTLNVNSPMETPAVNGGDILNYTTTITSPTTDDTPNDNTFTFHQTVVNSFDPNDKTCLEGTTISPAMVGEYVHYVIRFENTGTYPAENIVVKDMIDLAKFDINSLVPIKGSHEFVTNITAGNKVEFIFENINLPFDDANNDGFVAFKIKTKSSLVLGDTFTNSANIYFDYNFPIVTEPATTTVQTLSVQDFEFANYFSLYPNPVSNTLNIGAKETIEMTSINIYNTLGQLVIAIPNAQSVSNIDVSSLKTGNYFIKINSDKGTSNAKFIKE